MQKTTAVVFGTLEKVFILINFASLDHDIFGKLKEQYCHILQMIPD